MECNKEDAFWAKELAEKKMGAGDFSGAQKLIMKAKQLYPSLENLSQLMVICEVHCSAQNKIGRLENWYGILQVKPFADEAEIKKQYRKLALLLHPDKNRFAGAEAAFKLIGEANRLLTDHTKRSHYDVQYRIFTQISASKPRCKQTKTNSGRQWVPAYNATNSVGNQMPMNFAFWTFCQHCGFRYKYLREYVNTIMRCSSCQRSYVAIDTGPYGVSPRPIPSQFPRQKEIPSQGPVNVPLQNNSAGPTGVQSGNVPSEMNTKVTREEKLNKNDERDRKINTDIRKPETNKGGAKNDAKVSKADAFKPQSNTRGSDGGARKPTPDVTDPKDDEAVTVKSKDKRKRNVVEESREGSEIDEGESKKASKGNDKRRSSRKKRKVSYAEVGSDDDFSNGSSEGAKSDGSPAIEETHAERDEKKVDSVSEDNLSRKDKQSESYEANDARVFPSSKVDATDKVYEANKDNPELEEYPDPEFNNFSKIVRGFDEDQVWALYDSMDSMPRFYARIRKVSSAAPLTLRMTWLEPLPVTKIPKNEIDIPVACGKFKLGKTEETGDLFMFSHQMRCTKRSSYSFIYPEKGEIWALFRDWDISWTSNLDKHKRPYKYDFVEVWSDFKEKDDAEGVAGIGVYFLEKVKGFVSLFVRATQGKVLATTISPLEMRRFSHKIPSFKMTGTEGEGVPAGSFELDPFALPKHIFKLDPRKVNVGMDRQSLGSKADDSCPKTPEVETKCMEGPESVCSSKKRQKTERGSGSIAQVLNGISNDQDKIHTNVSLFAEVEDITSKGHDSSSSCQVEEVNTKTSEKSDQTVDASRPRRSTRAMTEKNSQTNSSQHKAEKTTAKDGELSACLDRFSLFGDKMNTRRSPRGISKTTDNQPQGNPKKHEGKDEPLLQSKECVFQTELKCSNSDRHESSGCRMGFFGDKMNTQKVIEKNLMRGSIGMRRSPRGISKTTDNQPQWNPKKHEGNNEQLLQSKEYVVQTELKSSNSEIRASSGCIMEHEKGFNFKEGRSEDKFQVNEIWALYSTDKGMPTEYGLIRRIQTTPRFMLYVTLLVPYPLPKNQTCGVFKKKPGKPVALPRSCFSHQVVKKVYKAGFEIYPRKGEIWALCKSNKSTSSTDTNEHDIVEVLENDGKMIKVMALTNNGSRRTLYVGSTKVVIDIPKEEVSRFSHQIPAIRQEQIGGWEVDPAAVPGLTIMVD